MAGPTPEPPCRGGGVGAGEQRMPWCLPQAMEWRQRTLPLSAESASSPNMCATNSDTVSVSDKAQENQCLSCETEGVTVSEHETVC